MSITPKDLKSYSVFEDVLERKDDLLEMDILEAETYIDSKLKKPIEKHDPLPEKLKLALLKVAQFFALINSDESMAKGYKSEKIGDYSYTLQDGSKMTMPDISGLISGYIENDEQKTDGVFLRVRSL
ncbi:DUF3199 family protein [Lentibacillus sp. N15]|uniref:protein YqbG n=1 Tax=Lentibacillus songyuanensis TaxID=3136161 RepID=UPI0031BA0478